MKHDKCNCGRLKDKRSKECAMCSRRSSLVEGERYDSRKPRSKRLSIL
jgi:hypothetical protein